ncbi:hypothetical protein [Castellaniella sp.]|uniref:hypothetical protein n=1 Tax=Castellaniella sp. TaxID=1955812 RepID=UPI002AFE3710|nr:hypothetical protein [Castellaniella sp.]
MELLTRQPIELKQSMVGVAYADFLGAAILRPAPLREAKIRWGKKWGKNKITLK